MSLAQLRLHLGEQIRVIISDGRVIEGEFQCMDKDLNFILGSAMEYHGIKEETAASEIPESAPSRSLGMTMVPGNHVIKCFLKSEER
mmetsp:Transcript_18441/g.17751  ORF Transcript_18441/g.17751 Transcript_18441/m.17751 type:complete len:87 (+) Transcript_18441:133-393(+)|eukprot:CAMPEP_0119033794 /NCGR_PEP_ID=MMETSP1177-20130426/863_1 /TAXON_ID=2985 /ORGANISM="Ochromonas sp, Strain CCMP1899" /LENGTH=86 /DNA_ID=CAMNT_0006990823 /DNA_START=104 /DNA_END=364 /DNA_ORIENTATION=+